MKILIETAENGYVIKTKYSNDEKVEVNVSEDSYLDDADNLRRCLVQVAEIIGDDSSRHSDKRVRIICLPGDKHQGKLSEKYVEELSELHSQLTSILDEQGKMRKKDVAEEKEKTEEEQ